jgi:tetratricopeptide (TPR) repeat protein
LLFLVGLFDRPAERQAIEAVLAAPAIPGLTDGLVGLRPEQWDTAANALRNLGLLVPKGKGAEDELDAHPLVREYFGARLSTDFKAAWCEAHTRLWHHYEAVAGAGEAETIEAMTPLAHAIAHAALAGKLNAAVELYEKRVRRKISAKGLYSFNISVLLSFFEKPWRRVRPEVIHIKRSMLFADAQNSLRSCGRLDEAAEALEANYTVLKDRQEWRLHVDQRVELIQVLISLGRLDEAIADATGALEVAEQRQIHSQKADIFCFLGHAHHMMGNLKAAEKAFKESTAAARNREDQSRRLSSFRQFALNEFYLDRGSKKVVRIWTRRTLEAAEREIAKRGVRASALDKLSLGRLSILEGDSHTDHLAKARHFSDAARYIEESLIDLRNNNQLDELPRALVLRAILRRQLGCHDLAQSDVVEALQICEHSGMPLLYVDACLEAARLELASGLRVGTVAANEYLDNAEKLVAESNYQRRRRELDELKTMVRAAPPPAVPITRRVAVRPPPQSANGTFGALEFLGRFLSSIRRMATPTLSQSP